jgi:hypothetical protein
MANPTVTPIMTPARGPNVPDAQAIYLVDLYGNPISGAEPTIETATRNGQAFTATTQHVTSPGAGNFPMSVFNPVNSNKNVLFYRVKQYTNITAGGNRLYVTTTDPAYATPITPTNLRIGGANSGCNATTTNVSVGFPTGTIIAPFSGTFSTDYDILAGQYVFVPAGTAGGIIVVFVFGAAQNYMAQISWLEF